jgi:hypothetical protein
MTLLHELSTRAPDGKQASLGVLSVHLSGERCRVGCEFCYLGAREDAGAAPPDVGLLEAALERLRYDEVAIAVSEPADDARAPVVRLGAVAARRGLPLTITTTMSIAAAAPELLDGAARANLSVDPRKGPVDARRVSALARALKARRGGRPLDVVLIVSLTTPEFAARLTDGLLAELVDAPDVDKVALNALKPPPPWCDRAFWLHALARLRPLLERALDRRLFLDCYVAARILRLGGCPARADLSPAPSPSGSGVAFRACVYQPAADFVAADADALAARLRGFTPPPVCPFPIV